MKNYLKRKINYSPYKIFQKNYQINNIKKLPIFNSSSSEHKKIVINISKNLKSVAISNKLFSNYMDNYINLTQDYCFKTPENECYPIRKNLRYLSTSSIKDVKHLIHIGKKKILKRPVSVNTNYNRLILLNKEMIKNINKNNHIKKRNNKSDLLLSLSEGEFLKNFKFNNSEIYNNIDLDNNQNIKNEHFEYLKNYVNNINNLNEIFDKTKLSITNILPKKKVQYELSLYTLCLKFRLLDNDKKIKINEKLYLKFKYLPIFYLLNYQTFKVFLSEIIYYDNNKKKFEFIKSNIEQILNKYWNYIKLNLKFDFNEITFYKNEFSFPLLYKWFVYNKDINNSNKNNILIKNVDNNNNNENENDNEEKTMIFELKIELPKIKIKILEYETKIKNYLKKSLMIQLMKTNFLKWEELILFELFFIKKFRHIINSILNNNKYYKQKINLISNNNDSKNKNFKININKNFEFFISKTNDNCSNYYIFNPYIITISRSKNKYYQEIHLTLRESKILYKFGKYWGIMNTLLKCININNEINNKINFKFDILENLSPKYYKINENTDKDKKEQMKFKFNKMDITIYECSLKKIIINNSKKEEKYLKIPRKILKLILANKDNNNNNNNNKNKNFLIENKISEYCKEINDEKIIEIKKENIKYDKEYDNSDILLNEKKQYSNKINNILSNNKNEFKKTNIDMNNNNNIELNDIISDKINNNKNKKIKNINVFLTKDLNKTNEDKNNDKNEKKHNHISFSQSKGRNLNKNQTLYLIKNKTELQKNRTVRDNYLLNNEIGIYKLKSILLNKRERRANTSKK